MINVSAFRYHNILVVEQSISFSVVVCGSAAMTGQYKLFLSKRLVTEKEIFSGGVVVNESGVIVDVLSRNDADKLIAESKDEIEVSTVNCVIMCVI